MIHNIYVLIDPRTDIIKYVGRTTNINARHRDHRSGVDGSIAKRQWAKELRQIGLSPDILVVEQTTAELAKVTEQKWMDHCRSPDLLNESPANSPIRSPRPVRPKRWILSDSTMYAKAIVNQNNKLGAISHINGIASFTPNTRYYLGD